VAVRNDPTHLRVAIVGSGFGGLGAAIRLQQRGIDDFLVFERADDLGGTWRDNSYPGCTCDVPSHLYSFSFAPNPGWSRSFSGQAEIWEYLRDCARRFGILPRLRFGHEVRQASWEEAGQRWRVETSRGTWTADVLVAAAGPLSEPAIPALPGLDGFAGKVFHSARWDHDHDLGGRQVAVVGTGASAIQFVPEIQPKVGRLRVFQRTAPWVLPRRDRALTKAERRLYRAVPAAQRVARWSIYWAREWFTTGFLHPRMMRLPQRLALRHLCGSVPDPELRARLTPDYTLGCKRVLLSNDYLPTLTRKNVELVSAGIREVRADGIVTDDGVAHPADTIIFGTGFRVTDMPVASRITGRDGRTLSETWAGSPKAYLGVAVAGFPNLFLLLGPNTGLGSTSVVLMIEAQVEYLLRALDHLRAAGAATVEPRPGAQQAFLDEVDARMRPTVWATGCASWYMDRTGRVSAIWPGFSTGYRRRLRRFDPDHHLTTPGLPAERGAPAAEGIGVSGPARRRVGDRLQFWAARRLGALPPSWQLRLAGSEPVTLDGLTLDPGLQLLLALRRRRRLRPIETLSPPAARRRIRRESAAATGRPLPVGSVSDLTVDGPAGPLPARHYLPGGSAGPHPLLLFLHGGGFVFCNLDTHDQVCRLLCREASVQVLSVDYRLAPEHPFPAAVADAWAALCWAAENAGRLGADPARLALGGDSAGGNLSAVAAQRAAREGGPALALQVLIYPAVDRTTPYRSLELFADGFFLTRTEIDWFNANYSSPEERGDARLSPLLGDLAGLAPALVVTAGFDPLRDEGEAYAAALAAAGTEVTLRRHASLIHGFVNMIDLSPSARAAMVEVAGEVGAMMAAARPVPGTAGEDAVG
jgi:cation diffusion facilitator CzcD-associated flavoprotein CzcO/acetyl esterase/lipase